MSIRVIGTAPNEELIIASPTHIETLRPRSTIKKRFDADAVFGPECATDEVYSGAVGPRMRAALAAGRSSCVLSLGAEQSGKSTTVRGTAEAGGMAVLAVRDLYAELAASPHAIESAVTVSAVCCAIVPAQGETAFTGKQPVREVLIDALGDSAQPAAGLKYGTPRDPTHGTPPTGAHPSARPLLTP